jgi:hypothetical protein
VFGMLFLITRMIVAVTLAPNILETLAQHQIS